MWRLNKLINQQPLTCRKLQCVTLIARRSTDENTPTLDTHGSNCPGLVLIMSRPRNINRSTEPIILQILPCKSGHQLGVNTSSPLRSSLNRVEDLTDNLKSFSLWCVIINYVITCMSHSVAIHIVCVAGNQRISGSPPVRVVSKICTGTY